MKWSVTHRPAGNRLADLHTESFAQVATLYDEQDPTRPSTYRARQDALRGLHSDAHRTALVNALAPMMKALGANEASLAQLERLKDKNALAVVTGQQSGLFGGPLYSIYKALTAIGLAERLERELGCPVVPVFWVASEDHDWDEVNHTYVLDEANTVRRIRLDMTVDPHAMVYHQPLTQEAVRDALVKLHAALPEGPAKLESLRELEAAWKPGMSLSNWFITLMQSWLGSRGLVFYDPCLPGVRELARPVWDMALDRMDEVSRHLDEAYGLVERNGFTPEVIRDQANTNLFVVRNGKRYVLERTDDPNRLRARGLGETASVAEWRDHAAKNPQGFSSNVLLRPVVQDFLLPTLCYVGGPSEIAYYPLSRGVFHAFGRQLPPLVLRQRGVLYPSHVVREMKRHGIQQETLQAPVQLVEQRIAATGGEELERSGQILSQALAGQWREWAHNHREIGPQIADLAERSRLRLEREIERMTQKAQRLIADRHRAELNQLAAIERWVWTDGHAQERRLSVVSLTGRYGSEWLSYLPAWGDYEHPGAVYDIELE